MASYVEEGRKTPACQPVPPPPPLLDEDPPPSPPPQAASAPNTGNSKALNL